MLDPEKTTAVLELLTQAYPDAHCALDYESPFELLVATILSAQCTDKQVNRVTPALFADYPTAESMAALSPELLEPYVKSCGFYHNKAKNIIAMSRELLAKHGGEVPREQESLTALPGVGRKTANVVMSNAFGEPAIAVDTHVYRVSRRIGLACGNTPEKVERELMDALPRESWGLAHHLLITHGRQVCSAQRPNCANCILNEVCEYAISG